MLKYKKGFTLIELLIVMVIIGILATIGMASFGSARAKARDARRKSDLQSIAKALEAYANDQRKYPSSSGGDLVCAAPTTCGWGEPFADAKGTLYMAKLPQDSSADRRYYYESNGSSFTLYATLENGNDPSVDTGITTICGSLTCNYKITSSNIN